MNKPPFFAGTAPDAWLVTPRTGRTPAEHACALERPAPKVTTPMRALIKGIGASMAISLGLYLALKLIR